MNLKILKAFNGDCILIETLDENQEKFVILIDGGTASTFDYSLKKELKDIPKINLLILTHIDSDHIGGLIRFFKNSLIDRIEIDEIWVNHPELIDISTGSLISYKQGDDLKKLIQQKKPKSIITPLTSYTPQLTRRGIQFDILSPTLEIIELLYKNWKPELFKEESENKDISSSIDIENHNLSLEELSKIPFSSSKLLHNDLANASSIAFILKTVDGKTLMFLGDSRSEIIEYALEQRDYTSSNPIECDFVKISHHGSKNNTSQGLLEKIKTNQYIISTNGGTSKDKHPSRETIARIVWNSRRDLNQETIIFTNYSIEEIKNKIGNFISDIDFESGNWKLEYKNEFILE
ncbi:ComEC/Rec2 family competence protein [Chryseobacterium indologenes]|jgi:beta-lactamase superfamily II metal-dependent hydrolase|uniref:ComEC/Rec2 family competence protein n=1 Tax=Chryseobacterium indologenes TaxID=253 RepID=UPI000648C89D|nr:MBL fold metallo-hydrolase [Chryseobacterium indologenes]